MPFLSQSTQYAISALILLAKRPEGEAISAYEIADQLQCPPAYLSQTLGKLVRTGILKSKRGSNGGVLLAKQSTQVYIYDIVTSLEGTLFFDTCFIGLDTCGEDEKAHCPFHGTWHCIKDSVEDWMKTTHLEKVTSHNDSQWYLSRLKYHTNATG